ncbi:unnamed protein product [Arabidopsis arenosa]|uniref:Brix domain-containing protein n=1 Tax=Arabidopsis arenosa TaxID=38785 RepID=A0A8S1ZRQ9_ARAAE|nr:unnamed protein product [Arabidopsis arenosa]
MGAAKWIPLIAALSKKKGKRCQTTHEKLRHRKKMEMRKMMIRLATEEEEEEEPERKICRELMDLNKNDIWGEFDSVEIDGILSGGTKPKILITTCVPCIAKELLSVFPNSKSYETQFLKEKFLSPYPSSTLTDTQLHEIIEYAKANCFTALIITDTTRHAKNFTHGIICIMSLLNGAAAYFELADFIPRMLLRDLVDPPSKFYPQLVTTQFTSPLDVGTERFIRSLFPKVSFSAAKRSTVAFVNYPDDLILFRHDCFCYVKAPDGKSARLVSSQECGPRFLLKLLALEKITI